jgi:4-amino-4-deoxy-L-arabinose transferase-like glycosyltransferase
MSVASEGARPQGSDADVRARGLASADSIARFSLGIVVLATLALHFVWLHRFRDGYPTEWDESGYIALALSNTYALLDHGLGHLLWTVEVQGAQAPLVPLFTVPFHVVFGADVESSLFVLPLYFALLVVAAYALARRVMSPYWALLAAVVVSSVPEVTDYTRLYHFAVPAAALMTAALWALLRSDGLRSRWWAVGSGALVGLMLLSRTMTIAYLPAFALAGAIQVVHDRERRGARAANFGLGAVAAGVVAATWYLRNYHSVFDYLSSAGYGATSGQYGKSHSPFSLAFWTRVGGLVGDDLYLPLAVLVAACLLLGLVGLLRGSQLQGAVRRDIWSLVAVVAVGYLTLSSTKNEGTAFDLPWLPELIVLACAAAARVPRRELRVVLAALLVLVSGGNILMKSGLIRPLATVRAAELPWGGDVPVTDGRGLIQLEVAGSGYPIGHPADPMPAVEREWLPLERRVAKTMVSYADAHGRRAYALVSATNPLFSNTRIALSGELCCRRLLEVGRLRPRPLDTIPAYRARLRGSGANFLITGAEGVTPDPTVSQAKIEAAARASGFHLISRFSLPDGEPLHLWWRDREPPPNSYYG